MSEENLEVPLPKVASLALFQKSFILEFSIYRGPVFAPPGLLTDLCPPHTTLDCMGAWMALLSGTGLQNTRDT